MCKGKENGDQEVPRVVWGGAQAHRLCLLWDEGSSSSPMTFLFVHWLEYPSLELGSEPAEGRKMGAVSLLPLSPWGLQREKGMSLDYAH